MRRNVACGTENISCYLAERLLASWVLNGGHSLYDVAVRSRSDLKPRSLRTRIRQLAITNAESQLHLVGLGVKITSWQQTATPPV